MSRPPRRPPPRHTVAVEIAGEKHVLRSDVPPEYTRRVAAHVDATIRALPGFQTLEPFRAATLAALSITDELFRARDEIRRLRDEAERRTAELADLLEAAESAAAERRPVRRPAPSAAPAAAVPPAAAPASPPAPVASSDGPPPPAPEPSRGPDVDTGNGGIEHAKDLAGEEAAPRDDVPAWMEDAAAKIEALPRAEVQDELELPPPESA